MDIYKSFEGKLDLSERGGGKSIQSTGRTEGKK